MIKRQQRILRDHPSTVANVQLIVYYLMPWIVLPVFLLIKKINFSVHYQMLLIITSLLMIVVYSQSRITRNTKNLTSGLVKLTISWFIVLQLLAVIGFLLKVSSDFSREALLLWAFTCLNLQIAVYLVIRVFLCSARHAIARKAGIIIGTGKIAHHLEESINGNIWLGHKIIGYLNAEPDTGMKLDYLGDVGNLLQFVTEHNISVVYIALPLTELGKLSSLYLELLNSNTRILWAPDIFDLHLINHHVKEIDGAPILSLCDAPVEDNALSKLLLDKLGSLIGLIVTLPITLPVALLIKLSSPGPVLFKQKRHGWNNKEFYIYKFRSMKLHTEKNNAVTQATKNDERFTGIGKWIRKLSIDELPQLINVLRGDMSLVGPRPHALAHNSFYQEKINYYLCRHKVKPGLTGLAQVSGCRGETDTMEKMENRIKYDLYYINNWSLFLDIKIILMTFVTLIKGAAY